VCRALKLLCAAPGVERLSSLKRASVSAAWELVGGATSVEELGAQMAEWEPDVVVVDAALGPGSVDAVRAVRAHARIVSLGAVTGADEVAETLDAVRAAVLGLPSPGGPVRSPRPEAQP
jgi:hypothetical protein